MQKVTEIYIYLFINGGSKRRNEVAEKSDISPGSIKKKKNQMYLVIFPKFNDAIKNSHLPTTLKPAMLC